MKRLIVLSAAIFAISSPVFAYPEQPEPQQEQEQDSFKLPTQDEIEAIKAQLPDFTAMLKDMKGLVQDEDFQDGLKGSLGAMQEHLDMDAMRGEDGTPDMSAIMGAMLDMLGDEQVMGSLIGQIEPLKELVEKHAPEAPGSDESLDWQ